MIVKTFRSQVGSPVAAGKEGEMMGGGGGESGKLQRRVVRSKPMQESTAPEARLGRGQE